MQSASPGKRVGWHRKKELVLVAPASVVAEAGNNVEVSSSDAGVIVKTPRVTLTCDDSVEYYKATVQVEARVLDATAVVSARLGELLASAHVKVVRKEEGPDFQIRIVPEEWGAYRAIVGEDEVDGRKVKVFKIAGRHPAIAPALGPNFEGQDSPLVRTMLAEIVADLAARIVVTELYRSRRNMEEFDADRLYREHYKRVTRFLPRLQKVLVDPLFRRVRSQTLLPSRRWSRSQVPSLRLEVLRPTVRPACSPRFSPGPQH